MAFHRDGFLSPTMLNFTTSLRAVPTYKTWFEFAEQLNRLGWAILSDLEIPSEDDQMLSSTLLFLRTHQSFQAAILLIERGMLADARANLRSAAEGTIAVIALANDHSFKDQLIQAHHYNQRKLARILLANPEYRSTLTSNQISELEKAARSVGEEEGSGKKFSDVNWHDTAAKYCPDFYNLVYRALSNEGAHITLNILNRFVDFTPTDQLSHVSAVKFGPAIHDMVEVLHLACTILLWLVNAFSCTYTPKFSEQIMAHVSQLDNMPMDEPKNVRVQSY